MKKILIGTVLVLGSLGWLVGCESHSTKPQGSTTKDSTGLQNERAAFSEKLDSIVSENSRTLYTYDSEGRTVFIETHGSASGSSKSEFLYRSSGAVKKEIKYHLSDGVWVKDKTMHPVLVRILGTLYQMHEKSSIGHEDRFKSEPVFDSAGNKISESHYHWANKKWEILSKNEYTYDRSGRKLSDVRLRCWGGVWRVESKSESTFDSAGNELTNTYTINDGGSKSVKTYDRFGNKLTEILYTLSEGSWIRYRGSECTYDTAVPVSSVACCRNRSVYTGNLGWKGSKLLSAKAYEWDSSAVKWTLNSTAAYFYSAFGQEDSVQPKGAVR